MPIMTRESERIRMNNKQIVVAGAGAAGLMAAGTAARCGASVTLIEKNAAPGKKLLITGKGRCNVLNACDIPGFIGNVPVNGRFLYSALSRFSPADTYAFFEDIGVPLKTERGNRCFPQSDRAADVVEALRRFAVGSGVRLVQDTVRSLTVRNGVCAGVRGAKGDYEADSVIVCCGGKSYPRTGSTGDGYRLARQAGHTVTALKPSLVPMESSDPDCKAMQGLALKNVALKIIDNQTQKEIYSDFGEMLFTHFGVSGPMILSASSHLRSAPAGRYTVSVDLKPALEQQQLDKRLQRDFAANANREVHNSLGGLLPRKMTAPVIRRWGVPFDKKCNAVTREERRRLLELLKGFTVAVSGFRPIEEAIVTSGGVAVSEINPKTMESKLMQGLYFAGEVLDVDAYTGGFNLQIAWSTGRLAGENASY